MQRRGLCAILVILIAMSSCSGLPPIKPADPLAVAGIEKQCLRPFPPGPYRLIHSVEAVFPGGSQINFIGILLIDPREKSIHSVIMTIEGFVLFDAEFKSEVKINRSVPPFDSVAYAEHMMKDIEFVIFPPQGTRKEAGYSADGSVICRFEERQGRTTDVTVTGKATWLVSQYNEQDGLIRSMRVSLLDERNVPARIDFDTCGPDGYSLHMRLISAEPVAPSR
ncbi:MAG: hypothetical protein JW902_03815 [Syntrophaceae bacterium]|nr:hypothetical protein [Syntrophaceae bacterium]